MKNLVIALLLLPSVLACIVPQNGMLIDSSVDFCSDVLFFDEGIKISGENLSINCNGAVFNNWGTNTGISIEHSYNVTLKNCRVINYNIGIYVRNSTNILLFDNNLIRNNIGTRLVVVSDSGISNNDVSLGVPFEIIESNNNAISLTNKYVEGSFCDSNFCNRDIDSVILMATPKNTESQLNSWLNNQIDTSKNFFDWVFNDLTIR